MMQMMQIAFLASPPLKNHLKKPSIRPPSSPSMCRVYVYLLRATPPRPPNYSLRSPSTTQLTPSTKAGFRNLTTQLDVFNQSVFLSSGLVLGKLAIFVGDTSEIDLEPGPLKCHPTRKSL